MRLAIILETKEGGEDVRVEYSEDKVRALLIRHLHEYISQYLNYLLAEVQTQFLSELEGKRVVMGRQKKQRHLSCIIATIKDGINAEALAEDAWNNALQEFKRESVKMR